MSARVTQLKSWMPKVTNWIRLNPLYKHRMAKSLSLRHCGILLGGISPSAVSYYEDGSCYPTHQRMAMIAKLLYVPQDVLEREWDAWYRQMHPKGKERRHGGKAA